MDPDYSKTMAGDQALMESLEALGKSEAHVKSLTAQVAELSAEVKRLREAGAGAGDGGGQDLQVKEVCGCMCVAFSAKYDVNVGGLL